MAGFNPETQIKFQKVLLAECSRCGLHRCDTVSLTVIQAVNLTVYFLPIIKTSLTGIISPILFDLAKFNSAYLILVEPFHQYFQVAAHRPARREWHLTHAQ